jgi:hypothetical protein
LPVEKFVPVHEVALVEDHISTAELPLTMELGLALRLAVGATGGPSVVTVTVTDLVVAPHVMR